MAQITINEKTVQIGEGVKLFKIKKFQSIIKKVKKENNDKDPQVIIRRANSQKAKILNRNDNGVFDEKVKNNDTILIEKTVRFGYNQRQPL